MAFVGVSAAAVVRGARQMQPHVSVRAQRAATAAARTPLRMSYDDDERERHDPSVSVFESASRHTPPTRSAYGASLTSDLALIDAYARSLDSNAEHDPLVAFLQGCAHERHGRLDQAVVLFQRAANSGMQHIPAPYEHAASCLLALARLEDALDMLDLATRVRVEAVGNASHISTWWYATFGPAVPQWVGRPWALQRGVLLYLAGRFADARAALVVTALEHAPDVSSEFALWDLACTARAKGVPAVQQEMLTDQELQCAPDGLCELLELFRTADPLRAVRLRESLQRELAALADRAGAPPHADLHFYLALYYDAYVLPVAAAGKALATARAKRDELMREALELGLSGSLAGAARVMLGRQ